MRNRSSQTTKRVRFSSPISDIDRSSNPSLSTCSRAPVLLATCKAFAISLNGSPKLVRLLIDPGSELTLVSSKIIDKLKLSRSPGNIPIQGVGSTSPGATQGQVSLVLQSTYSSSRVHLKAFILPKITSQLPSSVISEQDWPHLRSLKLSDPDFLTPDHIDILIGADNLRRVLKSSRLVMGGDSEPIAFHTRFGWAVLVATSNSSKVDPLKICHAISNDSLDKALTKFWVQEEVSSSPASTLTLAESQCEQHFVDTHSRLPTGRYMVRLPFSKDISTLGHSRSLAMRCLERLLKKFETDRNFKETYSGFLKEYESLGHMVPVPLDAPEPSQAFYLPHHGVWREQSSSTKLRVVFNGSAKSSTGISLNDLMHTVPKTQTDIFDVLLWIRQHKYIFITDILKMFRQIQVHPKDHDLQRVLWVNESSQVQAYQLTSVTYGTRSAPYLACRILKQLVEDEGNNYPLAVNPILKGSYVDDISGGAETIDHLNAVASQLEDMCSSACLPLDKWKSISWNSQKDVFTFHQAVTKRIILSEVAQLFDPLGLLSPVVIKAKILMQRLWLEKVGWDDHLTPDIVHEWSQFRQHLSQVSVIETPRWINLSSKATSIQIHGFSDASQLAMAAVIYIKVSYADSSSVVRLLCAKTKVAPLKRLTIPRLELSAAALLAKMTGKKEFVGNRVAAIHVSVPHAHWKFISGKLNPADCASRGLIASQLIDHPLWWSGPPWLSQSPEFWPSTSQGFLKAFRRFTSRRGIPKTLRSDCGTNFQGSNKQLKDLLSAATKESLKIQRLLSNDGTNWIFNPPAAPHMGGKWEAAVKSIKYHLKRTISDTLLTFEDFSTFLAQVEAVLNSRPLSSLSKDPDDIRALTPGHFIRGEALTTIPEPSLIDISNSRLSHFQRIQERFQQFWRRLSTECLQAHQTTSKWQTSQNDIREGSLVLITDERLPPSKWPLARVIKLHPGKDGLCRVVTLKTATSTITRPIVKLAPLPLQPHTET
ncbi:uncharacterized protein LOC122520465 [Polistes fuscatus]|uniref:uncharacterized protein LOC122520465 n=1 Tax=Polistes fuscatus TaxID=30207 RepID=UPI001CA9B62D|nr:uncharacterized protein LOC122520465 [Polistes fuscatus]